jgi:hypothetical protein
MNRNQKIALGCGGAGCLGLIVLIAAGAIAYFYYGRSPQYSNRNYNFNANTNRNSNLNRNSNTNSNTNSSSPSSSMSDSDRHKLYQAAGVTKDTALIIQVMRKVGLGDGTGADHQQFIREHMAWAMKNTEFVRSINTPEKARAYVDAHIND